MTFDSSPTAAPERQRRWQARLGAAAVAAVRSRWTWVVVVIWLIAGGILLAHGQAAVVKAKAAFLPVIAILALATIVFTDDPASVPTADSSMTMKRLVVALAIVGALALLAWYIASGGRRTGMMAALTLNWQASNPWLARSWAVVRTALLFVALPLAAMMVLKVAPHDLGLQPGHRSWRFLALWSVPVLVLWGVRVASGLLWPARLVSQLWALTRQRGFFEEFLFRGMLQSRLAPYGGGMSLAVQALVFAGWHAGVSLAAAPEAKLVACAVSVFVVLPIGVALGVVFVRTRNLLAPSILNVLANTIA